MLSMADFNLYNPFEGLLFAGPFCFLCGQPVSADEKESVFPAWLMARYNFAHQEVLLLDKTITTYQNLNIPCCTVCQHQHLAPLEEKVQAAAAQGLIGLRALDEKLLFQWLGKMFYGMLVRELIAEQDPLIPPTYSLSDDIRMLDKFQSFFKVLQSIRVPMQFADFVPFSLFMVPVKLAAGELPFEYRDDLHTMVFSLKLEDTWLICCLLDNGIIKEALHRLWQPLLGKQLEARQAAEFLAQVYYAAYLFNVIPEYFVRPPKPHDTHLIMDTLIDDITATVFNPWQLTGYAHMFEEMLKRWGITEAEILRDPNQPLSFLFDAAGNFRENLNDETEAI